MVRRRTSTSNFGVGRRESHDATAFYGRFRPPEIEGDESVVTPQQVKDPFVCGDARKMNEVEDGSVALVVTSPPYFAGKTYEEELAQEGVPGSYLEYLELLAEVLAECVRKLEPGGRVAVNVANLGRKPYRSLSSDVIRILQDDLGLLLRGELVWQKAEGASGSCAWGSYRSAANPVLRDVTERVIVASKGRFDRALTVRQRQRRGLPHESTLGADDFMALTLDLWAIPPESARRVGHPAPFPVELPEQLIRLYTFQDDLVLDPFMGSGSALVAAARLGRRYVGYDLDPAYVNIARSRVGAVAAGVNEPPRDGADQGLPALKQAEQALAAAGFAITARRARVAKTGVSVDFVAEDSTGQPWMFDVAGSSTSYRGGLLRMDAVWRALGRACALTGGGGNENPVPLVLLTTHLPAKTSEGYTAIRAAGPAVVFDVIDLGAEPDRGRLSRYGSGGRRTRAHPGFWTDGEVAAP